MITHLSLHDIAEGEVQAKYSIVLIKKKRGIRFNSKSPLHTKYKLHGKLLLNRKTKHD